VSTTGVEERLVEGEEHVSLRHITDAIRRLDELGIARLIGDAAELVHKAQKGGQPLGTLTLDAIQVLANGRVELALAKAPVNAYSAPERLRGAPGDRRSDVFSLGVVMWEALAHARLFEGKTDELVKAGVLTSEWRSATEHNANVPAELDAICKKALAREPTDRYQSAKVMAAEIGAVLDDASYPEGNDDIARYLAREFPEGPPKPGRTRMAETPIPGTVKTQAKDDTGKTPKVGTQTVLGMAPLRDEVAKPKTPAAGVPAKTPTPAVGVAATKTPTPDPEVKPVGTATVIGAPAPVIEAPRPRTPTPSSLPAWATGNAPPPPADPHQTAQGRPESSLSPTVLTSHPGMRVPAAPPGAEAIANPTKTAILGSNAGAELQAALAAAAPSPAPKPLKSIKDAETVQTAPVAAASAAPPARPTPVPPPERVAVAAASPSAVIEAQTPHPASVVALPRATTRGDKTGTGSKDVLAGWGWGTDKLDALVDDDVYEDTQRTQRKRLFIAIGGAAGAVLLIAVVALAFSSGDSGTDKKKTAAAAKAAAAPPAVQWGSQENPPPPPPTTPPPAPAPAQQAAAPQAPPPPAPAPEPPKTEPAQAAAAEPPKTEPPAPPAPPPPPPEPPKVAKPEPATPKKSPPKKPEVVARKADLKKTTPKPIDPYAATPATAPKADPAAAYKAGLLQFARGDSSGALATFRSSLAADPSYAPTWRGIGLVYEKLGKKAQARTAFRKYLQLNPGAGDADQIRERLDRLGS
jgi:tetratricopeptide repeat protein/protein kinase-like protein